jgi:ribosomal protein S18 acetylase RimI-like enzyme
MKIEIRTHNWNEVDLTEIAQLMFTAKKASPFWRPDRGLDWYQRFIQQRIERFSPSFAILARAENTLVGMISVITADPTLYDLWRWHPVILPGENEDEIASALIDASIRLMKADDVHRLEVSFDFSKDELIQETEAYYQKYRSWYAQHGIVKLDESAYMICQAANFKLFSGNSLETDFEISTFSAPDQDVIYECFYQTFLKGKDRSFLGKTELQRQRWFTEYVDDPENLNETASLILLKNHQVIGFTIFKSRPHIGDEHLALIAIHPDHQGKKLGQRLLSLSMSKIIQQGNRLMSLGVDLDNVAAYYIYRKLGFEIQTKIITHEWKNEKIS